MKNLLALGLLALTALPAPAAPQLHTDTLPTVGAIGNSICRNQYTPMEWKGLVGTNRQWTAFGAFVFFGCDGLAVPDIQAFEGHSGKTSAEIARLLLPAGSTEPWGDGQKIPAGIASLKPDITVIISSTNDLLLAPPDKIASGKALEEALEGLKENIRYVKSIGSIPIVCNILPIEGLTPLVPGASIPNDITSVVPTWNTEIKELCEREDVWYCDIFSACAKADGSAQWKDGFVFRNGSEIEGRPEDAWKVHPSLLASLAIAREALQPVLKQIIGPDCPKLPADPGADSEIAPRKWKVDYDPEADSSFEVAENAAGTAEIVRFHKPSHEAGRYAQWKTDDIAVEPGQTYFYAVDLNFASSDGRASLGFSIGDRMTGSASRGQPLAGISTARLTTPGAVETGAFRAAGFFTVPAGITKVSPCVSINRSAGGKECGEDEVTLGNLIIAPAPETIAARHKPAQ